jgi:hypothetical protein
MTYTGEGDRVTLEMTIADYEKLLLILGGAAGSPFNGPHRAAFWSMIKFVNDLNATNPNFVPYEIPPEFAERA